ncbi:MAG TPA: hypothetical protein VFE51_26365 [Verrucomicrobiae bacterium]|nr:hypothetical protein [Verrucomicrobiae bacterium]
MPEIKFTCGQCGQHISCEEAWAGHQLACPACQNNLVVPALQTTIAPAATQPSAAPAPVTSGGRPRLAAGVTQIARASNAGPAPQRRVVRPPKSTNPAIKFAVIAVVLASIGVAAVVYGPGLLKQAGEATSPKPTGSAGASGGGGAGPLGEVNGAMDVSDALDGNSSSRPRPNPAKRSAPAVNTSTTNHPAKPSSPASSQAPGSK